MAEIDNLTISISASAEGAVRSVDRLASALKGLQNSIDRFNASSFINSLREIQNAAKSAASSVRSYANAQERANRSANGFNSNGFVNNMNRSTRATNEATNALVRFVEQVNTAMTVVRQFRDTAFTPLQIGAQKMLGGGIGGRNPIETTFVEDNGWIHVDPDIESTDDKIKDLVSSTMLANAYTKEFSDTIKGLGAIMQGFGRVLMFPIRAIGSFVRSLARIAFYRAIRAIIKDMVQGFKDLYGYSKDNGTQFAKSMDTITTSMRYLRNSIVAAVAPIVNALAPAFDYLTDKIVAALNWVNEFIATLTGADTYTVAKKVATTWESTFDNASNKAKQAAKDLKNTILGFDEINKLNDNSNNSSGGGSGSSPYTSGYGNMFETKPVSGKFNDIAEKIRGFGDAIKNALSDSLERIKLVVSVAKLALGAILTFSGVNTPLGIALMAMGAAEFAKVVSENWEGLDPKVKRVIETIDNIVGPAFLVIGAILAFSNINVPLGIALMALGAAKIVKNVTEPYWNAIRDKLEGPIGTVTKILSGAFLLLGILCIIGGHWGLGLGLIIAGAAGLAATASANWDNLKQSGEQAASSFKTGWDSKMGNDTTNSNNNSGNSVTVNVITNPSASKLWDNFKKEWETATSGDSLKIGVTRKGKIEDLWENVKNAWDVKTTGESLKIGITRKGKIEDLWENVKNAWDVATTGESLKIGVTRKGKIEDLLENVKNAWDIATNGKSLKIGITRKGDINDLWENVKNAWDTNVTGKSLKIGITRKGDINDLWENVKNAWDTNVTGKSLKIGITRKGDINDLWENVKNAWDVATTGKTLKLYFKRNTDLITIWNDIVEKWNKVISGNTLKLKMIRSTDVNTIWNDTVKAWKEQVLDAGKTLKVNLKRNTNVNDIWDDLKDKWVKNNDSKSLSINLTPKTTVTTLFDGFKKLWDAQHDAWQLTVNMITGTKPSDMFKKFKETWTEATKDKSLGVAIQNSTPLTNFWNNIVNAFKDETKGKALGVGIELEQEGWTSVADYVDEHSGFGGANRTGGSGSSGSRGGGVGRYSGISVGVGLEKDDWNTVAEWVKEYGIDDTKLWQAIGLARFGWTNITNWVDAVGGTADKLFQQIGLDPYGWTTIPDWVEAIGSTAKTVWQGIGLDKWGWNDVTSWVDAVGSTSNSVWQGVSLYVDNWDDYYKNLETGTRGNPYFYHAKGGVVTANGSYSFASGGYISDNINYYAGGTAHAHGTMFVAGEAGPEIVGHIGGRTEILNKSQLAQTMFAAVRSAMNGVQIDSNFYGANGMTVEDTEELITLVRAGSDAIQRQNDLIRQQNDYLRQINDKEFSAEISTSQINKAQNYANRRAGITVVPVGT